MTDTVAEPPLEAEDVYLYAHGNGAVFLFHPDRRSRFVTLAEALDVVRSCGAAGGRVFLAADTGGPLADRVVAEVRAAAAVVVDHEPTQPPYEWQEGSDALMSAAAYGQDDLLDDLLERGANVQARNDGGSTALHHAAAAGNLHAIDRLLAAGADPERRNDAGLTPLAAAQACREHDAALRLEAAGATPAHAVSGEDRFRGSHRLPLLAYCWTAIVFAFVAGLAGLTVGPVVAVAAAVVGGLVGARLAASPAQWRGVVPRSFDGRRLRGSTLLGRSVVVDLDTVTAAAYGPGGGALSGRLVGAKLLLVHPEGDQRAGRSLRRVTRPPVDADLVPDGARATVVLLDPWWEHEVLRPIGNRLISDPVALSPALRQRLQRARSEDPAQPVRPPRRGPARR